MTEPDEINAMAPVAVEAGKITPGTLTADVEIRDAVPDDRREVVAAWLFDFNMRRQGMPIRWSDHEIGAGVIADETLRRTWRSEADRLLDVLPLPDSLPIAGGLASTIAGNAIGLFRENRDMHGMDEEAAARAACAEIAEAASMDLDELADA
jgi:hypothetical protein